MNIRDFYKIKPKFVGSFSSVRALPRDKAPEIAFIGRSNVGKSSLINALWNATGLAKTSSTPGRTQTINLFGVDGRLVIADLPGYGFAKVQKKVSDAWSANVREYFAHRAQLRRVFVLVDSRVRLKQSDCDMMDLLGEYGVPYQVVFTKIDKLKGGRCDVFIDVRPAMLPGTISTSSESGAGLDELRKEIFGLLK